MTDWGVHIIDYGLFGMGDPSPKSIIARRPRNSAAVTSGPITLPSEPCCELDRLLRKLQSFEIVTGQVRQIDTALLRADASVRLWLIE